MRAAPLNYLLALALAGLLWILTSFVLGNWLGDNVSLLDVTVVEFVGTYRVVLTAAAVIGLVLTFYWLYYGSRPKAAGALDKARRTWDVLFFTAFGAAVVIVIVLVLLFASEQFALQQYVLFFLAASAVTYFLFWLSTLLWSPRTVMNCVRGRS